jgi:TRAP transporter 4TM/12TM fusion protein
MSATEQGQGDAAPAATYARTGEPETPPGYSGRAIFWLGVAFSAYQIYTAAYAPLSSLVMRSLHVGFLLLLAFLLYGAATRERRRVPLWDWLLGGLGFGLAFYHWVFEEDLILRSGDPSVADLVVGSVVVLLVFEAARRVLGMALPIICGLFLAYALFGQHLPSPLNHRGYGFDQVVNQLYLGTEGIYGIPILVSSTYIFLFILFGAFLEQAGMIRLFTDVALGTVGHTRGGPAKVAVVSSALMGTISGSGVANVVTTGQFTIPLMKRFGYRPAFAGAVEATASMGGQIMPPVMGAVAFIMAETLEIAYVEVVQAAIVPALLYFFATFWMVHLEAGRAHLLGLARSELPSPLAALRLNWHLILPLAALVYLLFSGYTPLFAGTVGLALTAVLILAVPVAGALPALLLRIVFWVVLGLAAATFFRYGIDIVFLLILGLVLLNFVVRGGRETLRLMLNSLSAGAQMAVGVGVACAIVGVIIAVMTLTGIGSTFIRVILDLAGTSVILALGLTMLTCLILGMGIPTIPNYIITSSLAGPALEQMGVPLLVSHMFVFYFGIMADLTPPVALAAFAAAPIAGVSGMRIGMNCLRIAIAGFVIPYMAVYDPNLMLQGGDPLGSAYVIVKAVIAICLWGGAAIGFLAVPLAWPERVLAAASAFLVVVALPITDQLGLGLAGLLGLWLWYRHRRLHTAPA